MGWGGGGLVILKGDLGACPLPPENLDRANFFVAIMFSISLPFQEIHVVD